MSTREDHDSPWKEALEDFFRPFLEFLYPQVAKLIDWDEPVDFLNAELQKITSGAESHRCYADKLVQVVWLNGEEYWLLIHIEVQGEPEANFAERMFTYYYRIRDRYKKSVISLAVLTDTQESFRPQSYSLALAGCAIRFDFLSVKLLDWWPRLEELKNSTNPFALLIAAQLTAKKVKDGKARVDNLIAFYRLAIKQALRKDEVRKLLIFLEWLVAIPEALTPYYNEQINLIEEDSKMAYNSLLERFAIEKGIEQGREEGMQQGMQKGLGKGRQQTLLKLLQLKFQKVDESVQRRVETATDAELELWIERILFADSLEALFADAEQP